MTVAQIKPATELRKHGGILKSIINPEKPFSAAVIMREKQLKTSRC